MHRFEVLWTDFLAETLPSLAISCHLRYRLTMPNPQLSVRSARAKELAHRLAKQERRSIAQVVESALEDYSVGKMKPKKETDAQFWHRMAYEGRVEGEPDIDLEVFIDEHRKPHTPIEL
jgi:hypothetical protein